MSTVKPSPYHGYQGFTTGASRVPEALKPGETRRARDQKFAGLRGGVAYRDPLPLERDPYCSVGRATQGLNVTKSDFCPPDKRGVMAKKTNALPPRKFIASSEYSATFANYIADAIKLSSFSEDAVAAKFAEIDRDGSGYVDRAEIRDLLQRTLDSTPPARYVDLLLQYFDTNRDGKVSQAEFAEGLSKVAEHLRHEIPTHTTKHSKPAWMQQRAPRVVGAEVVSSTAHRDVGGPGVDPRRRKIVDSVGSAGTTKELEVGTSKHSSNPPGYGGFVPSDARNERAIEHGRAERTRDSLRKVHIQATYRHNPPGYTGHVPTAPHNVITQRQASMETTSGAAFADVLRMWDARKAGSQ